MQYHLYKIHKNMKSLSQSFWRKGSQILSSHLFASNRVNLHVYNNVGEQYYYFNESIERILIRRQFYYFPYTDQKIHYGYGNFDLALPMCNILPFTNELFRVCKSGALITYSPLYLIMDNLHKPSSTSIILLWTEPDTNQLCMTLISETQSLEWKPFFQEWRGILLQNPLLFCNVYKWDSPMTARIKHVSAPTLKEQQKILQHAIKMSVQTMRDFQTQEGIDLYEYV